MNRPFDRPDVIAMGGSFLAVAVFFVLLVVGVVK